MSQKIRVRLYLNILINFISFFKWPVTTMQNFNNFKNAYSSSHKAQITDFLEFLHEYCKEKSETCTKF